MRKIIDISQYNGTIDWNKVQCDGAIIRIAYRGYTVGSIKQDKKFLDNIKEATKAGIPVGIYFMSQAINEAEAREEAEYTVNQIKNFNIALPLFYDSELSGDKNNNGRADKLSKTQRTIISKAFCDKLKELGYLTGVYASTSWFKSNLDVTQLLDYYIWVAQYASKCTATHRKDMWQYTSKGSIAGISGNVDISYCYVEFKESIECKNNNYKQEINSNTFKVKVTADSLRIRKGAGTNFKQVGSIKDKGVYTIIKKQDNWGLLKSGVGWICLDYAKNL